MTDRARVAALGLWLALTFSLVPGLSLTRAGAAETARILYLGVEDDPLYAPRRAYTGVLISDLRRPVDGARLAMRGTRVMGRALGLGFELDEILLGAGQPAAPVLAEALAGGALAVLLDLPPERMAEALVAGRPGDAVLVNIRDRDPRWRGADCDPALLHTIPSHDMLSDALAQHLRARGWERVALLSGDAEADATRAEAARRALAKFGLTTVDDSEFRLTNDPRQRDLANVLLLTGRARADVLWLIDSGGEFGRQVPYATYYPTPVVGTEGLRPTAWHPAYERHGAPQLNQRFERLAGRAMQAEDWAAWAGVRAVVEAVSRTRSADPATVADHLRSGAMSLDLYKGVPGSFRGWDGQLRQPVLLATHNAVIAWAPVEGFEHRSDTLDTLGPDRDASPCRR